MNHAQPVTIYLKDYQPPDFLIDTVDLEFNLEEEFTLVKSCLAIRSASTATTLQLQGEDLELVTVRLDGRLLSVKEYQLTAELLIIPQVPAHFILEIETRIKPQENLELSGLYKSSGNFCTQCEAEGFRRITYFLDRPDVMSRYRTTIVADQKRYPILLSNGNLIAVESLPQGKHRVSWEDPFKKPSYLFALVAGQFELIEDEFITQSKRRVKLNIYVEKGNQDKCAHAMNAVKKAMRWDEEKYGREYDLDIYMIVAVSDFNMGAMENKGLNIFNTKYILAKPETATDRDYINVESVIAHEYFHNWTGNRVTCRDWFQLSLKEGLTIFRDQSFTADTTSQTVARIHDVNHLRNVQFVEDSGPMAHSVRPESYIEINNFYTATIYIKGAEVIRMMRTILGEKLFRQGMDLYFERHDGQAVTIEDFVCAMEAASAIDLTQFRRWYSEIGTPVLKISDHYNAENKEYNFIVEQEHTETPLHIPFKMGLLDEEGNEITQTLLQVKKQKDIFQFDDIPSKPIPSFLREFSAPVKIHYPYQDHELQVLFKHDTDGFNRWEAGQRYALNVMLRFIKGEITEVPEDFLETFSHVLQHQQDDLLLLAELLALPSEQYISEEMKVIDVDAIHAAHKKVSREIAQFSQSILLELYGKLKSINEMGARQLKNRCLAYLMDEDMCMRQYRESVNRNMTDTLGALECLIHIDCQQRIEALDDFYQQFQHDVLVIDKWFELQALSSLPTTLETVKTLLHHPDFDIKNPNRVYALIGMFVRRNHINFHVNTGEGYQFLRDVVLKLDKINPTVAARMVSPFIHWRRYDEQRQKLMSAQLKIIAQEKSLSKDVFELVNKSLSLKHH